VTRILVAGAASWNRMVVLDALPEPRPQDPAGTIQFSVGFPF
jgi:hypothetical protein